MMDLTKTNGLGKETDAGTDTAHASLPRLEICVNVLTIAFTSFGIFVVRIRSVAIADLGSFVMQPSEHPDEEHIASVVGGESSLDTLAAQLRHRSPGYPSEPTPILRGARPTRQLYAID